MASLNGLIPVELPHQARSFCLKSVLFGWVLSEFCRILPVTQRKTPRLMSSSRLGEGHPGRDTRGQVLARGGQIVTLAS